MRTNALTASKSASVASQETIDACEERLKAICPSSSSRTQTWVGVCLHGECEMEGWISHMGRKWPTCARQRMTFRTYLHEGLLQDGKPRFGLHDAWRVRVFVARLGGLSG